MTERKPRTLKAVKLTAEVNDDGELIGFLTLFSPRGQVDFMIDEDDAELLNKALTGYLDACRNG